MTIQFNTPVNVEEKTLGGNIYKAVPSEKFVHHGFYGATGKTLLDYFLVILSLPVVLPLIAICAAVIALGGGVPFYWQKRLGRSGNVFHMLKIRTMVQDADEVLEAYLDANPEARREWDHKQKLCHDPRVTRVGRILRKTSIDELPQLWNVLKGDMSLIGPRPMMVEQKVLYPGMAYYRMRPGISGLWQVSDRNESSFSDRAAFDTEYYRNMSFKQDVSIFLRTIGVVLRGTGY